VNHRIPPILIQTVPVHLPHRKRREKGKKFRKVKAKVTKEKKNEIDRKMRKEKPNIVIKGKNTEETVEDESSITHSKIHNKT
jgi:hypothetical protein